jgi:hypothetical protein
LVVDIIAAGGLTAYVRERLDAEKSLSGGG